MTANLTRNLWSYMIIFCGHFPDGALHFTEEELEDETRAEWYLRQMLGSANFEGGRLLHIMSRQPRLPDRAPPLPGPAEQPVRRDRRCGCARSCDKYDLPYTTGPLHRQYGQALRTIIKLSLPNRFTSSDQHSVEEHREVGRGRPSDAERPSRSSQTGGWSSRGTSVRGTA